MIRAIARNGEGEIVHSVSLDDLQHAIDNTEGLLWLDLHDEARAEIVPLLRESFCFHPLAIEDALDAVHVPKIDDWGDYIYLVLGAVNPHDGRMSADDDVVELDIFLGQNFLVTLSQAPIDALERVWTLCERDARKMNRDSSYLLYLLMDEIATDYIAVAEEIDDVIDRIEANLFARVGNELLNDIFGLKRHLLQLRRTVGQQREIANKLARGDFPTVPESSKIYFRDVYDHFVRLYDLIESLRDLLSSALDTYLSVVNNRMNDTMKTLTVITTLFMPLSFLTGFFGMNFFQPVANFSAWTDRTAFMIVMAIMIGLPIAMYMIMRRYLKL
ncbi:MAG: magnesium/cobalt transporter CorA [Anaerolineales bacterium]|nr:magnesium/cobalt transporter CorA [Anaerolineales bacterium]MCB9127285.1 magnesium/cobalt transporter CorA [Ardenticatenales bacterium]MCB9172574.1 magnesium/cobalt transporter CorA [Ardenticatenales bacterium]